MSTPGIPEDTASSGLPEDVAAGERVPESTAEAVDVVDNADETKAPPPRPPVQPED